MKILELFSGSGNISRAFTQTGHEAYTVDRDSQHNPTLRANIADLTASDLITLCNGDRPDVIWASPDCATYSTNAISYHRNGTEPISEYARFCDNVNIHLLNLIKELQPKYWFIENPIGKLRKMPFMQPLTPFRYSLTYCQYGSPYQKPTDIWTNHPDPQFKRMCKRGSPCHTPSPRGATTGINGLRNAQARSVIPFPLCQHIAHISTHEP